MIDREYEHYFLACDICGQEKHGFEVWQDAVDYAENNGWKADRGETLDMVENGWIDICPDCVARGK